MGRQTISCIWWDRVEVNIPRYNIRNKYGHGCFFCVCVFCGCPKSDPALTLVMIYMYQVVLAPRYRGTLATQYGDIQRYLGMMYYLTPRSPLYTSLMTGIRFNTCTLPCVHFMQEF